MPDGQRCDGCRYFRPWIEGAQFGGCHRYAPRPGDQALVALAFPEADDPQVSWPMVHDDYWCGEWTAPPPAPPACGRQLVQVGGVVVTCGLRRGHDGYHRAREGAEWTDIRDVIADATS